MFAAAPALLMRVRTLCFRCLLLLFAALWFIYAAPFISVAPLRRRLRYYVRRYARADFRYCYAAAYEVTRVARAMMR